MPCLLAAIKVSLGMINQSRFRLKKLQRVKGTNPLFSTWEADALLVIDKTAHVLMGLPANSLR